MEVEKMRFGGSHTHLGVERHNRSLSSRVVDGHPSSFETVRRTRYLPPRTRLHKGGKCIVGDNLVISEFRVVMDLFVYQPQGVCNFVIDEVADVQEMTREVVEDIVVADDYEIRVWINLVGVVAGRHLNYSVVMVDCCCRCESGIRGCPDQTPTS